MSNSKRIHDVSIDFARVEPIKTDVKIKQFEYGRDVFHISVYDDGTLFNPSQLYELPFRVYVRAQRADNKLNEVCIYDSEDNTESYICINDESGKITSSYFVFDIDLFCSFTPGDIKLELIIRTFDETGNISSNIISQALIFSVFRSISSYNMIDKKSIDVITALIDIVSSLQATVTYEEYIDRLNNAFGRIQSLDSSKVDKVDGKGLSENDFTDMYVKIIDGLAAVASSGSYKDLKDKLPFYDLGTFIADLDPDTGEVSPESLEAYHAAIDGAKATGIYTITWCEGSVVEPRLFITIGGINTGNEELVYQLLLWGDYYNYDIEFEYTYLPKIRVCKNGVWKDSDFQFETSFNKASDIYDDASNSSYPSSAAVVRYVADKFSDYDKSAHKGEITYNPQSELSQSGKAVAQAIASIVNSAPGTLDTLQELAKALGDDPNFATTIMELLGNKVDKIDGMGLSTNDYNDLLNKPVIDLGTFRIYYDENNEAINEIEYENFLNAIDNARQTGIYKIAFEEVGIIQSALILVIGGTAMDGTELITQMRLMDFPFDMSSKNDKAAIQLPQIRKYYDDGSGGAWTAWGGWEESVFENTNQKVNIIDENNKEYTSLYPSVFAVYEFVHNVLGEIDLTSKIDKTDIAISMSDISYDELATKIPSWMGIVDYALEHARFVRYTNEINNSMPEEQVPSVEVVQDLIYDAVHPTPITTAPTTLEANKQYNLGWRSEVSLAFPTIAHDGDVIYVVFWAEDTSDDMQPNLIIDTTNTCDIELIPEQSTGYEIFAKYKADDSMWIVNYSEYTVSAWGVLINEHFKRLC